MYSDTIIIVLKYKNTEVIKMDQEKMDYARTLIAKKMSNIEVRTKIKEKFGKSVSNCTLRALRNEYQELLVVLYNIMKTKMEFTKKPSEEEINYIKKVVVILND